MKCIIINGVSVNYVHTRSDRRTISATVDKEGVIQVRSPRRIGDEFVREFILRNEERIFAMLERSRERVRYEDSLGESGLEELRRRAKAVIPERVEHFSKIMGVRPARVRINAAKTRFGSCSDTGNLNFSCRLMAYSSNAVDYVVIHELAHLVHMDHSPAFWRTVAKYMPDYNTARQELKRIPGFTE